mmetsp:Transcript_3681/g.10130  ORF Transcript_3681/g.10130 Transcript_3681/m.10130 type:complete len:513 (+) Transcript_3681:237-1775(+)
MKGIILRSRQLFWVSLLLTPWSTAIMGANAQESECLSPVVLQECHASLAKNEQQHSASMEEWRHNLNLAVQAVQEERTKDQAQFESTLQDTQTKLQNDLNQMAEEKDREISLLARERDSLQSALQALQQQLQEQELASSEALEQHGNALRSEFEKALQEEREKSNQSFEHQKKVLADEHTTARKTAVQEAEKKHAKELELKKKAERRAQADLIQQKAKVRALEDKYKHQTDELLAARQELLKANDVVRLYNEGVVRRWFLKPTAEIVGFVYDEIITPLAVEFYKVAHPVLDPIYEHAIVPAMPFAVAAWEFLADQSEVAWEEAVNFGELVRELAPQYFQRFLKAAWPFVQQSAAATLQFVMQVSGQVAKFYQELVAPHVSKLYSELAPIVKKALANTQKILLRNWKEFGKWLKTEIKTIDKKVKVPTMVVEYSASISKNPEETLLQLENFIGILFLGLIGLWLVLRLTSIDDEATTASTTKSSDKPVKKGQKKKGQKAMDGKNTDQFAKSSQ